jgi:amidase
VIWNIEEGLKLDGARIARAQQLRSRVYQAMRRFMDRYDFVVAAVSQVPPFPVEQPYVTEINGQKLATYLDWMKVCCRITATSHPAISVPAGFTDDAVPLPVGVQIVGRYREDFSVLQMAHAYEQANPVGRIRPGLAA